MLIVCQIGLRVSRHYHSSLFVSLLELQLSLLTFQDLDSLMVMLAEQHWLPRLSLGDYVTLGAWERLDIQAVVEYLREEGASYS